MSVNKSEPDRELRSLIEFGTMHACGAKIEWWTSALTPSRLTQQDAQSDTTNSCGSLQRYVVGVNEAPLSLLLRRPLTIRQKWSIMVTLDEFLDQENISNDTFDHWHKIWRYVVNMTVALFCVFKRTRITWVRFYSACLGSCSCGIILRIRNGV
jgi:hypothetical protein